MNACTTLDHKLKRNPQLTDEELLVRVGDRKDRAAFAELYDRYQKRIFNLAYRITRDQHLAEEAVQEGMVRVWKAASTFRKDAQARCWIQQVVARECLKVLRNDLRKKIKADRYAVACCTESPAGQKDLLEQGEAIHFLRERLDLLPPIERRCIELHYEGGLRQSEIGQVVSMPTRTVSFKIREGLKRLRSAFAGWGNQ